VQPPTSQKKKNVCQDCGLSSYLFNIFINDIIECLGTEETHSQVINDLRILGLLFADDFVITLHISYRLQKKIELVDKGKAIPL
jgi:hypothetical protein